MLEFGSVLKSLSHDGTAIQLTGLEALGNTNPFVETLKDH